MDFHTSVLQKEVLEALQVVPGEYYLDATLGGGGHTKAILDFGGRVTALDVDTDAINYTSKKLGAKKLKSGVWVTPDTNLTIYQRNFKDLDEVARLAGIKAFAGVLFDLGVSSYMLDTPERGFSFSKNGPLDMRMDTGLGVTASDLINGLNEGELYELFTKLGEERNARRLARDIVRSRLEKRIETTTDLAQIIKKSVGRREKGIDPATRVFMALRIVVNDELNNLREALPRASQLLGTGGRLAVISFHSLEDRIVKDFFKSEPSLKMLNKKPLTASAQELKENLRARSAKLRVAEKVT